MKKLITFLWVVFVFLSCLGDGNTASQNKYIYKIKKVIGSTVNAESSTVTAKLSVIKTRNYTIDTLKINLNGKYATSFSLKIECSAFEDITKLSQSVPHVNYIKFVNLKSNWADNITQQIFLSELFNNGNKFFTYSESNINLSLHPKLFISNQYIPTYATLLVSPKKGVDLETYTSINNYLVGDNVLIDGYQYVIISKN